MFLSGLTTIVSNEEMDDIMKIIKFLEESARKGVMRAGEDTVIAGEGTLKVGQDFSCCLIV